jgi:hypothetical protein
MIAGRTDGARHGLARNGSDESLTAAPQFVAAIEKRHA